MSESAVKMTTLPSPLTPRRVIVLAYDGLCTFEFGVAVEIFGLPRPEFGDNWYQFAVAAAESGEMRATGGIRIMADGGLDLLAQADTIIIPGWRGIDSPVPTALIDALRQAYARGCRIISICSGVFVLAATGLLSGLKATTHWRYTQILQQRFADITVVNDVLYVAGQRIMTSAGSAAGIDLCLHVVREDYGLEIANSVARRLVIQPHRDGSQAQTVARPVASARESQSLGQLFDYLHQNLAQTHSLDALAQRAGMSTRTLLRRFALATGTTPARWILRERLRCVQDHLMHSQHSIEAIAELTGFGNASVLRQHFRQHFSLSPTQFRKEYRRVKQ
ncbi:transcriptional regulator FtrA [Superficieibacter sp. 1612_C1]|uniref:transcriptional regulator FtrA n=1 Tax=Superficieibacter sp. 1612_C1 TaxID=2780382 RepID=UPI00188339C0|nr:transcriptional regulator FtrA [Superficieibacter sp. 1612_C1]